MHIVITYNINIKNRNMTCIAAIFDEVLQRNRNKNTIALEHPVPASVGEAGQPFVAGEADRLRVGVRAHCCRRVRKDYFSSPDVS